MVKGSSEELSLVQVRNWTASLEPSFGKEIVKPVGNSELICSKHKAKNGSKLALLVHVIDGFIIEESNLPFKVDEEENEITESLPVAGVTDATSVENTGDNKKEDEIISASLNSYPEDKDELMSLLPTSCKYCGGKLPEQRAMWGKRFCSVSCGKKYSVTCSQRVRKVLQRQTTQHSGPGRGGKRMDGTECHTPKRGRGRGRGRRSSTPSRLHTFTPDGLDTTDRTPEHEPAHLHFEFPPRFPLGFGLDSFDIENELYDGVEPINNYSFIPVVTWTVNQVAQYISSIPGCTSCAHLFEEEEIDGQALLLLTMEHMIHTMNLKLGPALKIASQIRNIKLQHGIQTRTKYLSSPI